MQMKLFLASVLVLGLVGCAGGADELADGSNDGTGGNCASREALLAGTWITPKGSTTSSSHYNLVTYRVGGGVHVYQYAYGSTNTVDYQAWRVSGSSCDKIELKYNGAWLSEYSIIYELNANTLDIQATDGSYYGRRSQYDRLSSGYVAVNPEASVKAEPQTSQGDFLPIGLTVPDRKAVQP